MRIVPAVVALIAGSLLAWLGSAGLPVARPLPPDAISEGAGYRFVVDLRDLHPRLFTVAVDTSTAPAASDLQVFENGRPLGPPHSVHAEIEGAGAGRFSHWDGYLFFSSSDGSDPRRNGKTYRVETKARLGPLATWPGVGLAAAGVLGLLATQRRRVIAVASTGPVQWVWKNVVPGATATVLTVALIAGAGEAYLRMTTPFATPVWPSRFDPRFGFAFEPGALVRHTNHFDFWTEARANRLGFLDSEPPAADSPGCRVALIGDSFVEAAQVTVPQKVQSLVGNWATTAHPSWGLHVSAFGNSGTGQLNQLPFYDLFARPQHPNLVVLVFVSNDFANNSTLLEAVRNGWDPDHPPRLFARPAAGREGFELIPIDPGWQGHLLPSPPVVPRACRLCDWHDALLPKSLAYQWLVNSVQARAPQLLTLVQPVTLDRQLRVRREALARRAAGADPFAGWAEDAAMDFVYYEPTLPPLFEESLRLTGFALDEFKRRADADGARLAILTPSQVSLPTKSDDPAYQRRYFERIKALADARQIPVLDQFAAAADQGIALSALGFRHDAHWSLAGHALAASMLETYLDAHPDICAAR